MKKIDKLILIELIGPWVFGVAMFTMLIVATEYLFKITSYLVAGAPPSMIFEITLLVIPGVLVKTFAMATLLAALLAFGRLSGDSEIVALRAAGASIFRIVAPVAAFSTLIAIVAFTVDESLVPYAARRSEALLVEIEKKLDPKQVRPSSLALSDNRGNVTGIVAWRDFDQLQGELKNATITYYGPNAKPEGFLYANKLKVDSDFKVGVDHGWSIEGGGWYISGDGRNMVRLDDRAWPPGQQRPSMSTKDILASLMKNLDALSMAETAKQIETMRKDPKHRPDQLANLEYGYWNKIALPLAAVIYGLLGAPLGIRSGRQSPGAGFAIAVGIIFAYVELGNFLNIYAMGGQIPAWLASFTPLMIGLIASIIIMWRRNH